MLVEILFQPEADCRIGFCIQNVAAKIRRDGGGAVSGWDITWEEDGLLEAESHMVWESPRGTLVDITPRATGEPKTLFLPQPGHWDGSKFIPNKRMALADTPRSRALFILAEMQDRLKRKSWNGSQWFMTREQDRELKLIAGKIAFGVPDWQPCPCGSRKTFGSCCGRPKGKPWRNF